MSSEDPFLWLEALDDARVLDWVTQRSEATLARLSGLSFATVMGPVVGQRVGTTCLAQVA